MVNELEKVHTSKVINLSTIKEYNFDNRYVGDNKGNVYLVKEKLNNHYLCIKLSPYETRGGYIEYVLTTKDGSKKHVQVHRVVAALFLPKVKGKDFVNHRDGDKNNNKSSNLQYMTHSENIKHTYDVLGREPYRGKNK